MYLVLLTLRDILLAVNQCESFVSFERVRASNVGRSESESKPVVSSAYRIASSSVALGRSLIKHRKRMGPRQVPWKTDMLSSWLSERVVLTSTVCVLLDR